MSYLQHFVYRRKVLNPFEDDNVVGINNYADLGFELSFKPQQSQASAAPAAQEEEAVSDVAIVGQVQVNRGLMFKSRLSSANGISLSASLRGWNEPSWLVSLAGHFNPMTRTTTCGLSVSLENMGSTVWGETSPLYRRTQPSVRQTVEYDDA